MPAKMPENSAAIIDEFKAIDFSSIDHATDIQQDLISAIHTAAHVAYVDGYMRMTTVAVYEGRASETGHEEDEGVLVRALIKRQVTGEKDTDWISGEVLVDNPAQCRADKFKLWRHTITGKRSKLYAVVTDTPVRYSNQLHPKVISGNDSNFWSRPLSDEQVQKLHEQVARIIGNCAVNMTITQKYVAPENLKRISTKAHVVE